MTSAPPCYHSFVTIKTFKIFRAKYLYTQWTINFVNCLRDYNSLSIIKQICLIKHVKSYYLYRVICHTLQLLLLWSWAFCYRRIHNPNGPKPNSLSRLVDFRLKPIYSIEIACRRDQSIALLTRECTPIKASVRLNDGSRLINIIALNI